MTERELDNVVAGVAQWDGGLRLAIHYLRKEICEKCRVEGKTRLPQRHLNAILAYILTRNIMLNECLEVVDSLAQTLSVAPVETGPKTPAIEPEPQNSATQERSEQEGH